MKTITNKDRVKRLGLDVASFHHGYEYVDLDLPSGLLWAKCNVGAEKEIDFGDYFQHGKGGRTYEETLMEDTYCYFVDTASEIMGGKWRMPTQDEFRELVGNTDYNIWCEVNGVYGTKFSSKKDKKKYVFFPACGVCNNGSVYPVGGCGCYWSRSLYDGVEYAHYLYFNSGYVCWQDNSSRLLGFAVRGVVEK